MNHIIRWNLCYEFSFSRLVVWSFGRLVVWSFGRFVVLTKTLITPVNGISLSDFCSTLSAIAIMSKLTCHYPLNCCTFLSSGSAIAKQKHRFFEPKKPFIPPPSYHTSPLGETERGSLPHIILLPSGEWGGAPFLCFCFHKIGSPGSNSISDKAVWMLAYKQNCC